MNCCHNFESIKKSIDLALKKYGWYIHYIPDDTDTPYNFNSHTHNLSKKFGHPDLQIVFPLPHTVVEPLFSRLVNIIKNEKMVFTAGEVYYPHKGYDNYPITFIKAAESGREVLRVILPDRFGKVLQNELEDDRYLDQYNCLESR
jgi:hypothetical protein